MGFTKGHPQYSSIRFGKGHVPWNKGKTSPLITKEKHWSWKGGKPNCLDCSKPLSTYKSKRCRLHAALVKKEQLRASGIKGYLVQDRTRKPTSIETKVYEELKKTGYLFETQKVIGGKFIVDAFIPKLNLVIEVDGSYWHSLDRIIKKDKAENAYLAKCGYKVLRIPENKVSEFSTASLN